MKAKVRGITQVLTHLLTNLKKLLLIAWQMDRRVTTAYYLTAGVGALGPLATSLTFKYLIDELIKSQTTSLPVTIPLVVVVVLAARYLVGLGEVLILWGLNRTYFDHLFRYKFQNELSRRFYQKLSQLDVAYLEDPDTQSLIGKAKDAHTFRPASFLRNFSYLFGDLVSYASAFLILLPFGWWIPLAITTISLPRLYLRTRYGRVQWSVFNLGVPRARRLWYLMWFLSDETSLREMRIFQSQKALLTKFKKIQDYLFRHSKKALDNHLRFLTLPPILEVGVIFAIAYLHLPSALTGVLSVGSFTLLVNMMGQLGGRAGTMMTHFGEMYEDNLYIDQYFDVLELPKLIKEVKKPVVFEEISPPKIEFKNVFFRYPKTEPMVLKDVSFMVNPGENIAFVGPNGAGKSTIIKLICRFYDVTEGEVLINEVNIKKLKLSNWYRFMGTLFQDFAPYHFTARDNIALGDPEKRDEDLIREAAARSGAYEFIKKLPKGFDQMLGREFEEGRELSIGQWQKLAIARAFYREAPLLILDEPTSAIDAEAEYEIFTNLQKSYKDKTLILVSHRFSTVRNASKIFVVEDGRITERGSHQNLLKLGGKYTKMFRLQAKGYK